MTERGVVIDTVAAGHAGPAATGRWGPRRPWRLVSAAALLVAVVAVASVTMQHPRSVPPSALPSPATVTYTNPGKSFRIQHPSGWQSKTDRDGGVVFQAAGQTAVSVSEFTLGARIDPQDLQDMRSVTDAILRTPSAQLTVLMSQVVHVDGLTGLYYLYTFPSGKQRGVHAHYFLFSGNKMFTIVCQVVPASDFQHMATTFDSIARSFVVTAEP